MSDFLRDILNQLAPRQLFGHTFGNMLEGLSSMQQAQQSQITYPSLYPLLQEQHLHQQVLQQYANFTFPLKDLESFKDTSAYREKGTEETELFKRMEAKAFA